MYIAFCDRKAALKEYMQVTNALITLTCDCIIDGVVKMPLRASIFTSWLNKNIQLNNERQEPFLKGYFRAKHQGSGNLSQSLIAVTGRVLLALCDRTRS